MLFKHCSQDFLEVKPLLLQEIYFPVFKDLKLLNIRLVLYILFPPDGLNFESRPLTQFLPSDFLGKLSDSIGNQPNSLEFAVFRLCEQQLLETLLFKHGLQFSLYLQTVHETSIDFLNLDGSRCAMVSLKVRL